MFLKKDYFDRSALSILSDNQNNIDRNLVIVNSISVENVSLDLKESFYQY